MDSITALEGDLRIASQILEWEIGDIWGHVGVRQDKVIKGHFWSRGWA